MRNYSETLSDVRLNDVYFLTERINIAADGDKLKTTRVYGLPELLFGFIRSIYNVAF